MAEIEIDVSPPPVVIRPGTAAADDVLVVVTAGPPGPQGPPGTGSADPYVHHQSSASASWVITHNLSRYPQVTVVDNDDQVVIADVIYASANVINIVFAAATTGAAYIV